jgi:hypothetical protein
MTDTVGAAFVGTAAVELAIVSNSVIWVYVGAVSGVGHVPVEQAYPGLVVAFNCSV